MHSTFKTSVRGPKHKWGDAILCPSLSVEVLVKHVSSTHIIGIHQ